MTHPIRRDLSALLILLAAVSVFAAAGPHAAAAESPPNLVIILTDDMGYGDPGFMGGKDALTPELDALAASGLMFRHAYANGAVCAPTRAALLSGMTAARTGVYTVGSGGGRGGDRAAATPSSQAMVTPTNASSLDPDVVTLAEALRGAGYATGHAGKWHLGTPGGPDGPAANGFDFTLGASRGGGTRTYYAPWGLPGLDDAAEGAYLTDRLTDEAVGFIQDHRDRPFFLYVSHYAVHTPIEPDPDVLARVKARAPQLDDDAAAYAAVIESFDTGVGRVLDALDHAGVAKNTLVVFASDNGGHRRHADIGGLKGHKGTLDEGGIRVPCTVRWPGVVAAGGVSDTPVVLMDLYPTFLQLAGARPTPGQPIDGRSWVELLRNPSGAAAQALADRPLVWYLPLYGNSRGGRAPAPPQAAIRRGPWKLTVNLETQAVSLFNLADDPAEARDRAAAEPAVVAALQRDLTAWQRATDAPVPTPNPGYRPGASDDADSDSPRTRRNRGDRSRPDGERPNRNRRNRGSQ